VQTTTEKEKQSRELFSQENLHLIYRYVNSYVRNRQEAQGHSPTHGKRASFVNLQVMPELLRGYKMSDVIAVLGSLDFVVGEVDR